MADQKIRQMVKCVNYQDHNSNNCNIFDIAVVSIGMVFAKDENKDVEGKFINYNMYTMANVSILLIVWAR